MAEKIYTKDGIQIGKVMRDLLNTWEAKPCRILFEDLGKDCPSIMLQQMTAAEKVKQYVNGSYIGIWNFSIYVRINEADTAKRFDAIAVLEDLAKWLTEQDERGVYQRLPELGDKMTATKIEMTAIPSIAMRYENGVEDYQAMFALEYRARR